MGSIWVDNLDPNNEVGSYQTIWVDNLDPFWLYHFPCPKKVWVDNFKTNGTTKKGDPLTSQTSILPLERHCRSKSLFIFCKSFI